LFHRERNSIFGVLDEVRGEHRVEEPARHRQGNFVTVEFLGIVTFSYDNGHVRLSRLQPFAGVVARTSDSRRSRSHLEARQRTTPYHVQIATVRKPDKDTPRPLVYNGDR
ncbi:hypothetical protein THAOC_06761, partial [Thalassiosira oceanica]